MLHPKAGCVNSDSNSKDVSLANIRPSASCHPAQYILHREPSCTSPLSPTSQAVWEEQSSQIHSQDTLTDGAERRLTAKCHFAAVLGVPPPALPTSRAWDAAGALCRATLGQTHKLQQQKMCKSVHRERDFTQLLLPGQEIQVWALPPSGLGRLFRNLNPHSVGRETLEALQIQSKKVLLATTTALQLIQIRNTCNYPRLTIIVEKVFLSWVYTADASSVKISCALWIYFIFMLCYSHKVVIWNYFRHNIYKSNPVRMLIAEGFQFWLLRPLGPIIYGSK